jgi:(1->4)-alpha-D-glucan 1-alpha-D-glucosylmutase
VASSLAVALAQTWSRILPPAIVVRDQVRPWLIDLRLPAALDAQELRWILRTESGETYEQAFAPVAQPQCEHTELDGQRYIRRELSIEAPCGLGYHQLSLRTGEHEIVAAAFVVAPSRCFEPEAVQGDNRVFGSTLQLYSVRSERNWGIGDFTDLVTVFEQWGHRGGGIVGVNPLHALFAHDPERASPYSPSSRLFLNTLYLDVLAIEDYAQCDEARSLVASGEFQARLKALRIAREHSRTSSNGLGRRCASMHFTKRSKSDCTLRTPPARAGRYGRSNTVCPTPRRSRNSRQASAIESNSMSTFNGRPIRSLRVSGAARLSWVWGSDSIRISPFRSIAAGQKPGLTSISMR